LILPLSSVFSRFFSPFFFRFLICLGGFVLVFLGLESFEVSVQRSFRAVHFLFRPVFPVSPFTFPPPNISLNIVSCLPRYYSWLAVFLVLYVWRIRRNILCAFLFSSYSSRRFFFYILGQELLFFSVKARRVCFFPPKAWLWKCRTLCLGKLKFLFDAPPLAPLLFPQAFFFALLFL